MIIYQKSRPFFEHPENNFWGSLPEEVKRFLAHIKLTKKEKSNNGHKKEPIGDPEPGEY
jgi:hypothetical protein